MDGGVMIFVVVTGLAVVAGTCWLVMNRPDEGDGVLHHRVTTAMLTLSGVVVAGTLLAGMILAL
jgi:hypothetical protein